MNFTSNITRGNKVLNGTVSFWFLVAVIGQWIFAYYVANFYGSSGMQGDFDKWNEVLPHGYTEGDTLNNWSVGIHLLLSIIIMIAGPLQFVPQIRNKAKRFHKWNGRIYLITSVIISLTGLIMIWTKGGASGISGDITITINALLIFAFAAMTIRTAMARKFEAHRQWAIRFFLVVNGVWFFRIGLMLWLVINGGPVGFDPETFRGPFLVFLGVAQYVLPLIVFEFYLRAQESSNVRYKMVVSGLLVVLTLAMMVGIFAATMGMWFPSSN